MIATGEELLSKNLPIWQAALLEEGNEEKTRARLFDMLGVMRASAHKALDHGMKTMGEMISGDARRANEYLCNHQPLTGETVMRAAALALSSSEVNASMGRICAAPTAGACGILPAVLFALQESRGFTDEALIRGLLTAGCVGGVIAKNATLSGANGGCQAECGSAAAMAAAAAVELCGGTPGQSLHAAAIALQNVMGLVCDSIAGLVESPCAKRNASGAANALLSADLALAGIKSAIPFDEVVVAMYKVGRMLPDALRETANGGIAATPTGRRIAKALLAPVET